MAKQVKIEVHKNFKKELDLVIKSLKETEKKKKHNRKRIGNVEGTKQIAKYLNSLRNINI